MKTNDTIFDKFRGCLFGQAVGDALGLGAEFLTKEEVKLYYSNGLDDYNKIINDYFRSQWEKGAWTDDTDMMMCIAKAIIYDKSINLRIIAQNFKNWFNDNPMGIGSHTFNVLAFHDYVQHPQEVAKVVWELSRKISAANGGLMRTSVVGLLKTDVEQHAGDICSLTHTDPRCIGSCAIISLLINSLVYENKELSCEDILSLARKYDNRIEEFIKLAQNDNIELLELDNGYSMGYTLKTLSAALWALWHCNSFEEGLLKIVHAGGDADTNAAVACAVLGAKYGYQSIPEKYIDGLIKREELQLISKKLFETINNFL